MLEGRCDPPGRETNHNHNQQWEGNSPKMAMMSPPPMDTPPLMTQDTSPSKNRMSKGFGSSGRTPSLVHFCVQTARFKAFDLNELNAMVQIVAESEFVCTKKTVDFLETFLV